MRSASNPMPIAPSVNDNSTCGMAGGRSKPRVRSEEPLSRTAARNELSSSAQYSNV